MAANDDLGLIKAISTLNQRYPGLKLGQLEEAPQASTCPNVLTDQLKKLVEDKKQKVHAMSAVKTLTETLPARWMEPYVLAILPSVLDSFGGGAAQQRTAEEAGRAIVKMLMPTSVAVAVPIVLKGTENSKWQAKVGSMNVLLDICKRFSHRMGSLFPEITLALISCIQDTKPETVNCALKVFNEAATLIVRNPDLNPILAKLISAYARPVEETTTMLDKLLETTFVATVDSATLGLLVPILRRGMSERNFMYKRKAALIIGNMCKLVRDPADAARFYPILEPVMRKTREEMAFEEVTKVCDDTISVLQKVKAQALVNLDAENRLLQPEISDNILKAIQKLGQIVMGPYKAVTDHVGHLCAFLVLNTMIDKHEWKQCIVPFLKITMSEKLANEVSDKVVGLCFERMGCKEEEDDDAEDICNNEFSLAYGGKILLQNTRMQLRRGHRYGLVGQNGVGKTTLLRNIASRNVEGLPEELKTAYVQHDLQGKVLGASVAEYVVDIPELADTSPKEVKEILLSVGFDEEKQKQPVSSLSGGWKMRLALGRAMLLHADLLLLDEPTNHLDSTAVAWLTDYLRSLTTVTCMIVSHSTFFLDDVCTDILHYHQLKLSPFRGNLSAFVKFRPEAASYYELKSTALEITFPTPGKLEGVKSRGKVILKMVGCNFTYPGASKPTLTNISCKATLASRVAILGVNGAGKSTLIRMLVGESHPDEETGEVWKHHNLRIAYVAQHSFHHIEQHLDKSPVAYIQYRFAGGMDREILEKETMALSEEAKALMGTEKGKIMGLGNRRTKGKELQYEVKIVGQKESDYKYKTKGELEAMGLGNLVKQADERIAAETAGLDLRPLTTKEVQNHLNEFGLMEEFGTWGKIGGLSGGQKVRLVLAAGMWNQPHLMVVDEPTNYLDREALGALAKAIDNFGGGVIMISHDKEFYSALCKEVWTVDGGRLLKEGETEEEEDIALAARKKKIEEKEEDSEQKADSAGANTNKVIKEAELVDFWGKPLNKKQIRELQKQKAREAKEAAKKGAA